MKKVIQQILSEKTLLAWSIFASMLVVFRILWLSKGTLEQSLFHPNYQFVFLIWNLFLAWLPLLFSKILAHYSPKQSFFYLILLLWLLFFPNAPYILTDLIHLRPRHSIPLWYDIVLLFTFASLGLWLAIRSLRNINQHLIKTVNSFWANSWVFSSLLLSGLGVYLGRELRWNSWDALINPAGPVYDTLMLIVHPFDNFKAWAMIVFFSSFMGLLYWTFSKYSIVKSSA